MPEISHILRALVRYPRHVILINQHDSCMMTIHGGEFLHVDHGPIRNASSPLEPGASFTL